MVKKGKAAVTAATAALGQPSLHVTAQQSRFDASNFENPNIKEIVVRDLNISVDNHDILTHVEFTLQAGRHYVLIGRNGAGKSTLLRAIAEGLIPSIPRSVRVLLLGQLQTKDETEGSNTSSSEVTVIQHVLQSDKQRESLLSEARRLSAAIENPVDHVAPVRIHRELTVEHLERDVANAKETAERTSGARGAKAREVLVALEAELSRAVDRLKLLDHPSALGDESSLTVGEDTQDALQMLSQTQTLLEATNASAAEARARTVLLGLGFSPDTLDQPVAQLSGGWKTRCSLACALCQSADVVLLDEPTNFLDLPSIIWLEQYIQSLGSTTIVVVVTHDRAFADGMADELLVLRQLKLERYRGNISGYETTRLKTYKYLSRMKDAQEKQKKHLQATIESNVKAAKRAGDDKKLKQAASRRKKLEERMGMEVSAKGTRFKLNRDNVGYYTTNRNEIEVPEFDPPATLTFPSSPVDLRFPGALVSFEHVSFRYGTGGQAITILRDVNLTIHYGERVGLVGLNGSGKSTLVSLAMGDTVGRPPSQGSISRHPRAHFGLFSQQAVEELDAMTSPEPNVTALADLMKSAGPEMSEQEARGLLASLGLAGKAASDVPLKLLSGGQKVRLALAKLLWSPPHLLILDEVTTHLDSDTIQALTIALRRYEGAIWVVTHDRFFLRCVVEGQSLGTQAGNGKDGDYEDTSDSSSEDEGFGNPGVVYCLSKGRLTRLERGVEEYEESAIEASAKLGKACIE